MARLLIEFIFDFMTNDAFRFAVLRRELSTLDQYGLTPAQRDLLLERDSAKLLTAILAEATTAGFDVDALRQGHCRPIGTITSLARSAAYTEGFIHIHCIDATYDPAKKAHTVHIRGLGFDLMPDIEFRTAAQSVVVSPDAKTSVRQDLYQHVEVTTPLAAVTWEVRGRNCSTEDFDKATQGFGTLTIAQWP